MPAVIRNIQGPINNLFNVVNFYITTGDHIGESNAAETEDRQLLVIIPLNKTEANDQADADRLEQQVSEIQSSGAVAVTLERPLIPVHSTPYSSNLRSRTPKRDIAQHFTGLHQKILSRKGVSNRGATRSGIVDTTLLTKK